ncbi:putative FlgJ-related protein [Sinobacterium caligoides]|uniref:Putative FlgJ-related protein n=1 Tax=Sinobacterium caligoides TaxID=933926 RepID=A0A3N2DGX4_9GAMM|nr:glucosaminidase domain-containing protein [Sinobacterium caligoides]ROR99056.1 putative FlgJ-related protein [Sinobacterium caligoides]
MQWVKRFWCRTVIVLSLCGAAAGLMLSMNSAQAEVQTFHTLDEYLAILKSHDYKLGQWREGDNAIARIYLEAVPTLWAGGISQGVTVAEKKTIFFTSQLPLLLKANETIMIDRTRLLDVRRDLAAGKSLSHSEQQFVGQVSKVYKMPIEQPTLAKIDQLLQRVDIVPASMALSQAAIESNWATSRFATEGNALFGQWTWDKKAAIKPKQQRKSLGNYGIAAFDTPLQSVLGYYKNLNTHSAYQKFRDKRAQLRRQGKPLTGLELVQTLDHYSERGQAYVNELSGMIRSNKLQQTDQSYLRDMEPVYLTPEAPTGS